MVGPMPYIIISTNATVAPKVGQKLLADIVGLVELHLDKPKNVTMARLEGDALVSFAGSLEPSAFVDIRAIGLAPTEARNALAAAITSLLDEVLAIPGTRTFMSFEAVEVDRWARDGKLLG
jgi:phenylpyruvate tautomerase